MWVPSEAQEAARDLGRARESARADLMRARHCLSKLLLRRGIVYSGGKAWTIAHDAWLTRQHFDRAGTQAAFEDAYEAVVLAASRRDRLDERTTALATDSTPDIAAVARSTTAGREAAHHFLLGRSVSGVVDSIRLRMTSWRQGSGRRN